jgi:hypothetical protein
LLSGIRNFVAPKHLTAALCAVAALWLLAAPLKAQEQQGPLPAAAPQTEDDAPLPPMRTPPPRQVAASPAPEPAARAARPAAPQSEQISTAPPSIPVDQIIQKFAEHETEFKAERDNFTYVQDVTIETIDNSGRADGSYEETTDITYPDGKRDENVTYAPPSSLQRIMLSQQDLDDVRNVQPFVLTTADLPKYNVTYVGRQKVDELGTYIFDVAPKVIEKNQRYFQGRVWVDDRDLEIVKSYGKAVPDIIKKNNENVFPRFETYRENIEGNFWFPTYTHADDMLHFTSGDVHIRMTIHYSDYKRFRVGIKLLNTEPVTTPSQTPPPPPPPKP